MNESTDAFQNTSMLDEIREQIEASISVKQILLRDKELLGQIEKLAHSCLQSLKAGGK